MEQKMSVGLDTSIGMPGQTAWAPTPSPSLKLDALQGNAEWKNPLSAQAHPSSSNPFTPSSSLNHTGLTPRYSPAYPLLSPGVSGEIAGVVDNPAPPSTSLSDLFASPEYPFSSVKTRSPNPPGSKRPPNAPPRPALRPPQPPSSLQPLHAPRTPAGQQKTPQPISMAYPASYVRAGPPHPPPLVSAQQIAHMSQSQQHAPMTPQQPMPYPTAQQQQHMSQPLQQVAPPPQSYGGYSVLPPSQHPQAPQPLPQPPRVEPMIAPLPARSGALALPGAEQEKKDASQVMPSTGHRSVLGSGIVSSAVQEAQVRARMKAETFAKNRKRKRHEEPVEEDKNEKSNEEDSKLSPEQLRKKRYLRRLALNRESAAVSRVRRREYVKLLEEQLVNAEKERVRLAGELTDMQRQHTKLRQHLEQLEIQVQERGGPAAPEHNREAYQGV